MNAVLTRELVQGTIEKLEATGIKPTHAAILAAIGGGSPSTLVKLMREIRGEATVEKDNQAVLRAFQEFWPVAMEAARKQNQAEIEELQGTIDFLTTEGQRTEGGSAAAADAIARLEAQREAAIAELTRANSQLGALRAAAELSAQKLSDAAEKNEEVRATLGREIDELRRRLSARDAELARASEQVTVARASVDQYSSRLSEAGEKLESMRVVAAAESAKLGMQIADEQKRTHKLEVELARVQGKLESQQERSKKPSSKASKAPDQRRDS